MPDANAKVEPSTKEDWLRPGVTDLEERTLEDVPVKGKTVKVRGLAAAYSNQAQAEAMVMSTGPRGEQSATFDTARMEILQFLHGVVEPKFSLGEVEQIARSFGPTFKRVIAAIDELSGVDKAALENAEARFPASGGSSRGAGMATTDPARDNGPSVRS